MSSPGNIKTVVVHGATGLQGGSVARALAAAGYTVRAAVRDPGAPKARELAALPGVQLARVDLLDVQNLFGIYAGADAIFACTAPGPEELTQGLNMVRAAQQTTGLRLFVWSALESIAELSKDTIKLSVPVFDNKAAVAKQLDGLGDALPHLNLYLGGFMENFVNFPGLARYDAAEDMIELQYSGFRTDVRTGMTYVSRDLPAALLIILAHPAEFAGQQRVALADHKLTPADMAGLCGRPARAVYDPTYLADISSMRENLAWWNSPHMRHYEGFPSPHPVLITGTRLRRFRTSSERSCCRISACQCPHKTEDASCFRLSVSVFPTLRIDSECVSSSPANFFAAEATISVQKTTLGETLRGHATLCNPSVAERPQTTRMHAWS